MIPKQSSGRKEIQIYKVFKYKFFKTKQQDEVSSNNSHQAKTISLSIRSKDGVNPGISDILAFYDKVDHNLFDTIFNIDVILSEKINYNNIDEIKNMRIVLQQNGQSTILRGFIPSTKQMIVQKMIYLDSLENFIQKLDEYKIHHLINQQYPNQSLQLIIPFKISKDHQLYSACVYIEKAKFNLYDYSRKHKVSSEQAYYIFITILDQIIGLHKLKIAHRDVKPQNILYTEEKGWVLSDYGESQEYQEVEAFNGIRGTKYFLNSALQDKITQNKKEVQNLLKNDLYALVITTLMIQQNEYVNDIQNKLKQCNEDYLLQTLTINSFEELELYKESAREIKLKPSFYANESIYKEMSLDEQALNKKLSQQNLIPLHNYYFNEGISENFCLQIYNLIDKDTRVVFLNPYRQTNFLKAYEVKIQDPLMTAKQYKIQNIKKNECTMIQLFIYGYNEKAIDFGKKLLSYSYNQTINFYLILAYLRVMLFEQADQEVALLNQGLLFDQLDTELEEYYFHTLCTEEIKIEIKNYINLILSQFSIVKQNLYLEGIWSHILCH